MARAIALNINIFLIGRLAAITGGEVLYASIPILVYTQSESVALTGYAFLSVWLPRILFLPIFGYIVDLISARHLFLYLDLGRFALITIAFFLDNNWALILTGSIVAFMSSASFVGIEKAITNDFAIRRTPRFQSKVQFMEQFPTIIGPLIAGFGIYYLGRDVLAGSALFLALAAGFSLGYPATRGGRALQSGRGLVFSIRRSTRHILGNRSLVRLIGTTISFNFLEGSCMAALPILALGAFGWSEASFGTILALVGLVNVLMLLIVARLPSSIATTTYYALALVIFLAGGVLFVMANSFLTLCISMCLIVAGRVLFVIFMRVKRSELIDPGEFGQAISIFVFFVLLPMPLAGLFLAWTDGLVALRAWLFCVICISAVLMAAFRWRIRSS